MSKTFIEGQGDPADLKNVRKNDFKRNLQYSHLHEYYSVLIMVSKYTLLHVYSLWCPVTHSKSCPFQGSKVRNYVEQFAVHIFVNNASKNATIWNVTPSIDYEGA